MRELGIKRWLYVLEFQTKTGDGWPHWHLMIDVGDLPGRRLNLARGWALWRDKWHLGGLDLAKKETKIQSAEHAVFYITKYLTKSPIGGYPLWVLDTHGVRFVQASRAVGAIVAKRKPKSRPAEEKREHAPRRTFIDRNAACRLASNVWKLETDHSTGEVRRHYIAKLPAAPSELVNLSLSGQISTQIIDTPGLSSCQISPRVTAWRLNPQELKRQLVGLGALSKLCEAQEARRVVILAENVFKKRREGIDAASLRCETFKNEKNTRTHHVFIRAGDDHQAEGDGQERKDQSVCPGRAAYVGGAGDAGAFEAVGGKPRIQNDEGEIRRKTP
jgi:hypothetical protein